MALLNSGALAVIPAKYGIHKIPVIGELSVGQTMWIPALTGKTNTGYIGRPRRLPGNTPLSVAQIGAASNYDRVGSKLKIESDREGCGEDV